MTSRRVGCGCTLWLFTTLGECGLSLSLVLRPIKTHIFQINELKLTCVGRSKKGAVNPLR